MVTKGFTTGKIGQRLVKCRVLCKRGVILRRSGRRPDGATKLFETAKRESNGRINLVTRIEKLEEKVRIRSWSLLCIQIQGRVGGIT